ncbi:MAG: trypsin-like peptidase domain-containing protein [Phycisphaerales bacterium]|nr:trypsin-like peptidase domain-containing protein [Phycisphaerales bacterium]
MTQFPNHHEPAAPPQRRSVAPLVLLVVSSGLLVFASLRFGQRALSADRPSASPRPVTARGDLAADEKSTIELFERCSPSVVYVSPLVRTVRRTLFGYVDGGVVESGTGSGFVWDAQGHIVTNFHVIQEAFRGGTGATVTLPDNTHYEAEIIGVWPDNDLAVLQIEAPDAELHPITVGTSNDLRVGQRVFAIGNPYGLDFTFTTGIVSALNREIRAVTGDTISGVIQTDAAINPGNSGGPLLDSAGRLIGINTAIYSQSGSSAGIGFAVPVDTINSVVPQLIAHGKVIKPGLGVILAPDAWARRWGIDGLVITGVSAGSGAELAGLRPITEGREGIALGDVIVGVDGARIAYNAQLADALKEHHVGDTVKVAIEREGKRVEVPVTLQAVAEQPRVMSRDR